MAWTAPRTWVAGAILTAAQLNTDVRDNEGELRAGGLAIAAMAANHIVYASSATQLTSSKTPPADGIQFPATQVSSADVNMLDDYEEGTWTPVIGGSGGTSGQAYTTQAGAYVKLGKLVWYSATAVLSTEGTITTDVQIQGLPFTAENTANLFPLAPVRFSGLATNWINIVGYVNPNTTTITFEGTQAAAAAMSKLSAADIGNTTGFIISGCYRATA